MAFFFALKGTDAESFGFGGTGKKSNKRQFDTYGEVMQKARCLYEISFSLFFTLHAK